MKIIATNIARPRTILWNGKEEVTGIYKEPVSTPIHLGKEHVRNDEVSDLSVHGGSYKACYLFASGHYSYWKKRYPHLQWNWGMFGENLTVEELDERELLIGSTYRIGTALARVSEPRQPCYKLGIKFGTQEVLRHFIAHGHPGTYVSILEEGNVHVDDDMRLVDENKGAITIFDYYQLLYAKEKDQEHLRLAITNEAIRPEKRERLKRFLK